MTRRRLPAAACLLLSCSEPTTPRDRPAVAAPKIRWVVPSVIARTTSLVHVPVASDSVYVAAAALEVAGYRVSDGKALWKRSDVTSVMPLIVGDTMVVTLNGDGAAAIRLSDGNVLWSTALSGPGASVRPVESNGHAVTADFEGNLIAARLSTGAVTTLANMTQLAGAPGQVWSMVPLGHDTLLVVSQEYGAQGRGTIALTRVQVPSGRILDTKRVPFAPSEFMTTSTPPLIDGLLVLPIAGGVLAVNAQTGARVWTVALNITRFALYNGLIYAGTGTGEVLVLDLRTGALQRRISTGIPSSLLDVYVCREGIYLLGDSMYLMADAAGARPQLVYRNPEYIFGELARRGARLFSSSPLYDIAVECT